MEQQGHNCKQRKHWKQGIRAPQKNPKALRQPARIYSLRTIPFNAHAEGPNFSPDLHIIRCLFGSRPCLLRQKIRKNKNTKHVARVVAKAALQKKWSKSRAHSHANS